MTIIQKLKILLRINSEFDKVKDAIEKEKKMDSKKWYQSKTIWSVVFSAVVSITQTIDPLLLGTPIATALIAIASAFGIYSRTTADTQIK